MPPVCATLQLCNLALGFLITNPPPSSADLYCIRSRPRQEVYRVKICIDALIDNSVDHYEPALKLLILPLAGISDLECSVCHMVHRRWTTINRPLWLLSSIVNSLYSFYWDVICDWDPSVFLRIFGFKNANFCSRLLDAQQWVYYWAIGSNLVLRCTWTYKLSAHPRHNYMTVFTITALEMLPRFQWIFFLVENEWNKMTLQAGLQIAMSEIPKEVNLLLDPANHIL